MLADSRQVNSVPPEAYLWLSPLPSSVRVCASLREVCCLSIVTIVAKNVIFNVSNRLQMLDML